MLFLMHLANTKYSSEIKATPCISHIILCGGQHPGSSCGDLKTHHYHLYDSCAGHTGKVKGLISRLIQAVRSQNHFDYVYIVGSCGFCFYPHPHAPVSSQRKGGCAGSWHIPSLLAMCVQTHLHQEQGPPGMHWNMYLLHGADTVTVNPVPSYLAYQSKDLRELTGTAQHLLLSTSALGDVESNVYWGHSCAREDRANNRQEVTWKTEGTFARSCWQSWEFSALYRASP